MAASLEHLEGVTYGPVAVGVSAEKVAEYVAATTDDPHRWTDAAPPSYAGAILFSIAPAFLWSEDVGEFSTVLVHTDQRFEWHAPLRIGTPLTVAAIVERVRVRGAMNFVTLALHAEDPSGTRILDSWSGFLMGAELGGEPAAEVAEPPVRERGPCDVASGSRELRKSASRVDLVRYAGASGDFNPVHFDHDAAREAGLPGIVVHGLMMVAWVCQAAAAGTDRPGPLAELKVRFRNPLLPAAAANVTAAPRSDGPTKLDVQVRGAAADPPAVTGTAVLSGNI